MFLKNAEGSYEPAFFIIRIESNELPEQLAKQHEATFVHEYLHFLQDLVMPYCMRENIVLLEIFRAQINHARETKEMHLPSNLINEEVLHLERTSQFTWGDNAFHMKVKSIDKIRREEEVVERYGYKLYKYFLSGSGVDDYQFGARDLLEYIASKIETRHFPDVPSPPDLPYRSVDLVLAFNDLAHLSDIKRIALAEYCLMNDNPAHRLMVVIEEIKDGYFRGAELNDDDTFIEFLFNHQWVAVSRPYESMADKLNRRYVELRATLQDQFSENSSPLIHAWLGEALDYAQRTIGGLSLFSTFYEMSTEQFKAAISAVISNLGVPLIVNKNGELGSSLGDESSKSEFIQLLLAYQFSEYIKSDETACPMFSTCERDNPELIDEVDCIEGPFRRASDEELCPFGVFVKTTGLSTVKWYKKDRVLSGFRSSSTPF
jgi:hypothetical protein